MASPDEMLQAQQALARQVDEALGNAAEQKGKRGRKLLAVAALVLLIAGAGFFVEKKLMVHPKLNPKDPPPGALVSLPQLTLNLADGSDLQVQLALRLSTVANTKEITTDQPLFANAEISVFGSETYASLLTPQGKAAAKAALLARFQAIALPVQKVPQVITVYFTQFVMQQA